MKDFLTKRAAVPVWVLILGGLFLVGLGSAAGSSSAEKDAASTSVTTEAEGSTGTIASGPVVTEPPATTTPTTAAPPTAPPQPVEVARFTGGSDKSTSAFTVTATWKIAWKVTGGAGLGIHVKTSDGQQLESLSVDPGEDESIIRQSCVGCYLDLAPFGSNYVVTVIDLPN